MVSYANAVCVFPITSNGRVQAVQAIPSVQVESWPRLDNSYNDLSCACWLALIYFRGVAEFDKNDCRAEI